jgi:hypothetical protein
MPSSNQDQSYAQENTNMNIKHFGFTTLIVATLGFSSVASAGVIPYPDAGTQNPDTYTFTAATTGDITAYFFASTASYTNELTMLVNGVATGIQGLNTSTSAHGTALNFGTVNAGDTLVFEMINISPGGVGPWYSDSTMNSDGVNHVYSTDFAGDSFVPAGTFVAFEDLNYGGDFNYNDETFVFTNVSTSTNVPEPSSLALMSIGALGFFAVRRRKQKTA